MEVRLVTLAATRMGGYGNLRRFVVLPKRGAETLALWILHTYAFPWRGVSGYSGVESQEKQCGPNGLGFCVSIRESPVVE
jgi:hypothetical protein